MANLQPGTVLRTEKLKTVRVIKELGVGGQGTVYLVDYDGQEKALKWYHEHACGDHKKEFYENLKRNVANGSPSASFVWPEDLTEFSHGSAGYIMDLRPQDYVVLSKFLLKQKFASYQVCVDALIEIVNAFRILHNKGYSYQDLNDGNFFINPQTGKVLICDNDNVAPFGYNMGIKGKSRFMAPEVVTGQKMPDKQSDRFSMAVILFMLLCKLHPLEGRASTPPCLTPETERIIYGESPIFVFDPTNQCNRPIQGVGDYAVKMWTALPDYLQKLFINAFSNASLHLTGPRTMEKEWIDALTHFRNSIVPCDCGNREFVKERRYTCSKCGKKLNVFNTLRLPTCELPAYPGVKIFRCEIDKNCTDDSALNPVAVVLRNPQAPSQYGLGNCSEMTWTGVSPSGQQRPVPYHGIIPIVSGAKAMLKEKMIEIV